MNSRLATAGSFEHPLANAANNPTSAPERRHSFPTFVPMNDFDDGAVRARNEQPSAQRSRSKLFSEVVERDNGSQDAEARRFRTFSHPSGWARNLPEARLQSRGWRLFEVEVRSPEGNLTFSTGGATEWAS